MNTEAHLEVGVGLAGIYRNSDAANDSRPLLDSLCDDSWIASREPSEEARHSHVSSTVSARRPQVSRETQPQV